MLSQLPRLEHVSLQAGCHHCHPVNSVKALMPTREIKSGLFQATYGL